MYNINTQALEVSDCEIFKHHNTLSSDTYITIVKTITSVM